MPETTKTCQVKMHDSKPCGRELYDDECCIFHSKKEDKDVKLFQESLNQIFKDERFTTYNCTHFIFPEGTAFPKRFSKSVIFLGAVFKGKADFQNDVFEGDTEFSWAVFKGKVDFGKAVFRGEVWFLGTGFTADADFSNSTFERRSSFASAAFHGKAQFGGCVFKGEANLHAVTFEKGCDFSQVAFQAEARFWEAEFKGNADLSSATYQGKAEFMEAGFEGRSNFLCTCFKREANFGGTIFQHHADFDSVQFEGDTIFWGHNFRESACFSAATFEKRLFMTGWTTYDRRPTGEVDFRSVKLLCPGRVEFQKLDLRRFRFLKTDLRSVHFTDVDWHREKGKGRYKVYDEVVPDLYTKVLDYELVRQLYRRLRANYEENLRYSEAGDFYIGEMEMTRKAQTSISKKLPLLFYKAISNYGESYYRPLGWIAAILVIFPLLFMFAGIQPVTLDPNNPVQDIIHYKLDFSSNESFLPTTEKIGDYYTSFLYSMSVFSFIRDKKYTTIDNWGHTFFVLESILSPVTLAFFLLALRRRFKR